jgi:hypothetical protein
MFFYSDKENGIPPRLYRHPDEIKRDIEDICERISEANHMLNVRNLISEIIIEESERDLPRRIQAVSELLQSAEQMLEEMQSFEESLSELQEELCESVRLLA